MYQLIDFSFFNDKDSVLVALQNNVNCPFEIKRVFYIFGVPSGGSRGEHANRISQFLFIALCGSCTIEVDNGRKQERFILDNPRQGLFLGAMMWKKMYDFSKDCVLLVLSDSYYDKDEYIYEYERFCGIAKMRD
ncbi:FdtA/QdtA family cupin domain-containing protein [Helicobacter mastomyrinus]|uniref:FdtA/QdtA family cupin domain-containing protein n=1 Tax=Helicobacter mastomyrinus TaxID=287948 RepID=A0ABZ3F413_9HELI|nr:FdtA/QdtA family cupin domain-containing protein [uncultured Helicobacter sp.]